VNIFITGGTGFLGRSLAQALRPGARVFLGGRNNEQNRVAELETGCPVVPTDVCRIESVRDAVVATRPDVIIHAAASKFVDLAERHPHECIDVNVLGSQHVARVAREQGVKGVLGISTDKAAPPVRNTYGLTKALMERLFCALDRDGDTRFACVRFGNIAWSTGSVFPIWTAMQAQNGGVIGSTGPHMRRLFCSASQAAQLIVHALDHLEDLHGHILAPELKAARVGDILDVWVKHKGGTWKTLAERPGDKLDEDMIGAAELPFTRHVTLSSAAYFLISPDTKSPTPPRAALSSANAPQMSEAEILELIQPPRET
jgi:FlaA1/EpsC-like NDP-sugar epimerase